MSYGQLIFMGKFLLLE